MIRELLLKGDGEWKGHIRKFIFNWMFSWEKSHTKLLTSKSQKNPKQFGNRTFLNFDNETKTQSKQRRRGWENGRRCNWCHRQRQVVGIICSKPREQQSLVSAREWSINGGTRKNDQKNGVTIVDKIPMQWERLSNSTSFPLHLLHKWVWEEKNEIAF